ncbi:MAG: glycosyltransferase [Planctomycetales bacterium]|nr:glycosyltransferase [Planctomycetales bacterium]
MSVAVGLADARVTWDGFEVVSSPSNRVGSLGASAREYLDVARGDRVVTFVDSWRLEGQPLHGLGALAWTAFETVPASPRGLLHLEASGAQPVAVSSFVANLLHEAGFEGSPVVPHTVDTGLFAPLVLGDRKASRALARSCLGVDLDVFVVGVIATNEQPDLNRKSLPEIVLAAASLADRGVDLMLWIHGPGANRTDEGFDLRRLAQRAGLLPSQLRLSEPPHRMDSDDAAMAVRYNAFDVLCQPSAGEGFCLPLIEAQACGVPVIASRFSAQPEQVGAGWLVDGQRRWIPTMGVEFQTPWISEITEALVEARTGGADRFERALSFASAYSTIEQHDAEWCSALSRETWPAWQ